VEDLLEIVGKTLSPACENNQSAENYAFDAFNVAAAHQHHLESLYQPFSSIGFLEALNFEKKLFSGRFRVISSYKARKPKKPNKQPRFTRFPYVKYVNYIYKFLE